MVCSILSDRGAQYRRAGLLSDRLASTSIPYNNPPLGSPHCALRVGMGAVRRFGPECASRLELVHIEPPLYTTVARSNQSCGMLQATAPSGSGSLRHSAHRRCVRRVELPPRPCAHGGLQVRNCRTASSKLRNVSRTFASPSGSPRQLPHFEGRRWGPEPPR